MDKVARGGSCRIKSCRHGNRRGCNLAQWAKGVTASRPHRFSTKLSRERAQRALGVGRGRHFSSSGSVLDGDTTGAAKLQTGCCLTLQVATLRIRGGERCFAAILGDGSVVTWGCAGSGGDSSSVEDQLKNVQQIQASRNAMVVTAVLCKTS